MNYQETIAYLYSALPMYQRIGAAAYRKDLTNTLKITEHLGFPHRKFPCIHVAGTNGKGSTSHMLASVCMEAGLKTGLYTSPHLKDFRERIRVNGRMVTEDYIMDFVKTHKDFMESFDPSFFEITVGMAFDYFAREKVDIAIIETGMGGRLDSTNVITPLISVITNIGMDHMQFLGDTPAKIAKEKAGIIKPGVPVVLGEPGEEILPVFVEAAKAAGSDLYLADDIGITEEAREPLKVKYRIKELNRPVYEVWTPLPGDYQLHNIRTVIKTIEVWNRTQAHPINQKMVEDGIAAVKKNTGIRGRWEVLHEEPLVIADVAHNAHGLKEVLPRLDKLPAKRKHFVLGFVNDKDLDAVIPLFPQDATYYISRPDIPRGMDAEEAADAFRLRGYNCETYDTVAAALSAARKAAHAEDLVYIGGSTFVVAEIL